MEAKNKSLTKIMKKNKPIIIFFVIIILISIYFIYDSFSIHLSQRKEKIEYGIEYNVDELVSADKEDATLSISDYGNSFCPKELGEQKLSIVAKTEKKEKEEEFIFNVEDKTPPIIESNAEISVEQFSVVEDILELCNVSISDNCDKKISTQDIVVHSKIDTLTKGSYNLRLTASDASGNKCDKTITVNVVDRKDGGIDAKEASKHIGENRWVYGVVYSVSYRPDVNGQPTFINISDNYPATNGMQVVIWGENRSSDMAALCDQMDHTTILKVKGSIQLYRDIPEIIVYSPSQIEIIGETTSTAY